ncbi:MAG: hypothetical protein AAFR00_13990 [Pseudomonadota bacterium]
MERGTADWISLLFAGTSLLLAGAILAVLVIGLLARAGYYGGPARGIGWQFIRYTVIAVTIPATALLAVNGVLTGEAAAIFSGALGYAFGSSTGGAGSNDDGKDS